MPNPPGSIRTMRNDPVYCASLASSMMPVLRGHQAQIDGCLRDLLTDGVGDESGVAVNRNGLFCVSKSSTRVFYMNASVGGGC